MASTFEELAGTAPSSEWVEGLADGMARKDPWPVMHWLVQRRQAHPEDLRTIGYLEIVRNVIVRDFLQEARGLDSVPKLTAAFLSDYGRFALSAQEGYLVSLIDGRITLNHILKLSPFDTFTTLFCFARLQHLRAIAL